MEVSTDKKGTAKKRMVFLFVSLLLGAVVGAVIWLFFVVMELGIELFWEILPEQAGFAHYPLVVCLLGGLIIGIFQKINGVYPQELSEVMAEVKANHGYDYKKLPGITISALLPLVFGGSVGPEAGLTGVIAGLCTWVGDRFKYLAKEMKEITNIGLSAALGTIFHSPFFGFMAPFEDDDGVEIPKSARTVLYFAAIFGGIGAYLLLSDLLGGGMAIGRFDEIVIGKKEVLWFLPLTLLGALSGGLYHISEKAAVYALKPIRNMKILCAVIGGGLLGLSGMFFPLTMFSGEAEMIAVMNDWQTISAAVFLTTGLLKIIITNVCIQTGWRGGNIFPLIFAGICIGFGMTHIAGIDCVFATATVTAALCGAVMRKPLAASLLLLLCFPAKGLILICAAAFIGSRIPALGKTAA